MIRMAFLVVTMIVCISCNHKPLRGSMEPSQNGGTYLAVIDDNGGHCGPIKVDGKVWPHPTGQAGRLEAGTHTGSAK
jgi:hypothetical protein